MQAERENKASVMTSSTDEHSGELVDRHQPLAGVVKRKRTKRPRHQPPASSSASSSESTTTEEEDMAHCLILLAQGGSVGAVVDSKPSSAQPPAVIMQQAVPPMIAATQPPAPQVVTVKSERYTSRKYTEAATTEDGVKAGFYVYECRTCNKCFPTFQALGGHRASHKKPRLLLNSAADEEIVTKTSPMMMTTASPPPPPPSSALPEVTTALSLNSNHHHHVTAGISSSNNSKLRVHECSICGAEFASGQALGGHMRRHRPLNAPDRAATATIDTKKEISIVNLELDLNLPAPLSDEEATAVPSSSLPPPPVVLGLGQFNDGNKAGLMLTASALVDCHY